MCQVRAGRCCCSCCLTSQACWRTCAAPALLLLLCYCMDLQLRGIHSRLLACTHADAAVHRRRRCCCHALGSVLSCFCSTVILPFLHCHRRDTHPARDQAAAPAAPPRHCGDQAHHAAGAPRLLWSRWVEVTLGQLVDPLHAAGAPRTLWSRWPAPVAEHCRYRWGLSTRSCTRAARKFSMPGMAGHLASGSLGACRHAGMRRHSVQCTEQTASGPSAGSCGAWPWHACAPHSLCCSSPGRLHFVCPPAAVCALLQGHLLTITNFP